jgi:hypothetical protein
MKNHFEIVIDIIEGMSGIGGVTTDEEFYREFDMRLRAILNISPKCTCTINENWGETKAFCCNLCGRPTDSIV